MMWFGHFTWGDGVWSRDPDALYATLTLRNTQSLSGWRSRNQRSEPPQVLSNGGQNKLILSASWTTQSKPAELQDALQVREPHLDLLALTPRLSRSPRCQPTTGQRPGHAHGYRAGSCVMVPLGSTAV